MMSPDIPSPSGPWPVLDLQERRILGVLIEKQKTTPDAYPLSINALVTGSNQKSNRDPILDLEEDDVEEALNRCKGRGLVMKIVGGRVDRWRHLLYDAWHVGKLELAILAELLLRGPQTEGELRTRASRMEPIEDLDVLRQTLRPLVERHLVFYLTPEERRGAVVTHGFHDPHELERLRQHYSSAAASIAPSTTSHAAPSSAGGSRLEEKLHELEAVFGPLSDELAATKQQVLLLEKEVAELRAALAANLDELRGLRQSLGG
jgi:uncharacterized protein YceH (UPF0502 family)